MTWDGVLGDHHRSARRRLVPAEPRRGVRGRVRQRGLRAIVGVGAGALRVSGQKIVDALIDLPFALPTAVAGITLTAIYAPNGWLGAPLASRTASRSRSRRSASRSR